MGPLRIDQVRKHRNGTVSYVLSDGAGRLDRLFTRHKLRPYLPTPTLDTATPKELEQLDVVQSILEHRCNEDGSYMYRVKWRASKATSWIDADDFSAPDMVSKYHRSTAKQSKITPPSKITSPSIRPTNVKSTRANLPVPVHALAPSFSSSTTRSGRRSKLPSHLADFNTST